MKEKIENLIKDQRERVNEAWEEANELSKISGEKISKEEHVVLKEKLFMLEFECSLRNGFITDLEFLF